MFVRQMLVATIELRPHVEFRAYTHVYHHLCPVQNGSQLVKSTTYIYYAQFSDSNALFMYRSIFQPWNFSCWRARLCIELRCRKNCRLCHENLCEYFFFFYIYFSSFIGRLRLLRPHLFAFRFTYFSLKFIFGMGFSIVNCVKAMVEIFCLL